MTEVWIVSDTHFGHASVVEKFKRADGSPLRDFESVDDMNEQMVARWNDRVRPGDKVIHLGDVVMNKKWIDPIMPRLNGEKRLIIGNHDIGHLEKLAPYFKSMTSMRMIGHDIIMTHIPIHPDSVERFGCNVHGHLHDGRVKWTYDTGMGSTWHADYAVGIDPRYLNVCVEHTDFAPIHIDEVRAKIREQQEAANYTPPVSWGNGSSPS